jgi:hypothetical protein
MDNKINYSITPEAIIEAMTKLNDVTNILKPYLIALSPIERHDLPKMSDGTLPFVQKCLDYCQSNPEYAPSYLDFSGLRDDMKVYTQLMPIFRLAEQLESMLNDTTMEVGAESYVSALSYYNSVKMATSMNVPGAKAIYEDLKKRFVKERAATPIPSPESN